MHSPVETSDRQHQYTRRNSEDSDDESLASSRPLSLSKVKVKADTVGDSGEVLQATRHTGGGGEKGGGGGGEGGGGREGGGTGGGDGERKAGGGTVYFGINNLELGHDNRVQDKHQSLPIKKKMELSEEEKLQLRLELASLRHAHDASLRHSSLQLPGNGNHGNTDAPRHAMLAKSKTAREGISIVGTGDNKDNNSLVLPKIKNGGTGGYQKAATSRTPRAGVKVKLPVLRMVKNDKGSGSGRRDVLDIAHDNLHIQLGVPRQPSSVSDFMDIIDYNRLQNEEKSESLANVQQEQLLEGDMNSKVAKVAEKSNRKTTKEKQSKECTTSHSSRNGVISKTGKHKGKIDLYGIDWFALNMIDFESDSAMDWLEFVVREQWPKRIEFTRPYVFSYFGFSSP